MPNRTIDATLSSPLDLSENEIERWNQLTADNPDLDSPFFAYDFSAAAAQAGMDVFVCTLRRSGEIVGFFPFQFKNTHLRLLGVAQRVGGELNDYSGIIATPSLKISWRDLLAYSRLNLYEISHLEAQQQNLGLKGESAVPSPTIDFSIDENHLNSKERRKRNHFLKETERRIGKTIEDLGPLRFNFFSENVESELERCMAHKREQYTRTGSADPLDPTSARKLLSLLARNQSKQCRGIVSTLYAGDHWLATHMGLLNDQVMHYWFPVYNAEFIDYSPGRTLIVKLVEHAKAQGVRIFDFGAGSSQMKRKFSNSERTVLKGLAKTGHPYAELYKIVLSVGWRINALKNRLSR
jgi:CelD/BcsL family acetyltransferase involved in cellulose biosynthesis